MPNLTAEYTVIAIYGGKATGEDAISTIDGTPGYLHLHIIRKDTLAKLPILIQENPIDPVEPSIIHQWGTAADKDLGTRAPIVSLRDIISYGNIGIGSAAKNGVEEKSNFVGGGEVFIIPCEGGVKAFRVTKGQGVFPLKLDDKCWTCEIANHNEALIVALPEQPIVGRLELLKILQKAVGQDEDMPFVAQFDARFEKEHLALRSNGLWAEDPVEHPSITLFSAQQNDPAGGHLLGDSISEGDQLNKHKGSAPSAGAKISLVPTANALQIIPIKKRLIAFKSDPHKFRAPLLQGQLATELQASANHKPVLISGGGIAGIMTALKLAELGIKSTLIEQGENLLSQTSGCTPARVGHGYHYRDLETAKLYLQSSITFLKKYCNNEKRKAEFVISVSKDDPELDCGLYFIAKDSQVPADELLKIYEGIRAEYKRLVELDPSNKIFGEVDDFFRVLDLEDYQDVVDVSKMAAVIRTQEKLLNWPNFSQYLLDQVKSYQQKGLIEVRTGQEVTKIDYDQTTRNQNFAVTMQSGEKLTASYVINSTWSSIEMLDSTLFPESAVEERTNRMKLIVSIALPEGKENIASMFTSMGPFSMFSNEGNGRGKITFAPVTNALDYVIEEFKKGEPVDPQLKEIWQEWIARGEITVANLSDPESWRDIECQLSIPPLYKRWLVDGLNKKEQLFFGSRILAGAVESYPILAGSRMVSIAGGIVKSNGEVNIRDVESNFHKRPDGFKSGQIGHFGFGSIKLFYSESQARKVVEEIIENIRANILIKKEITHSLETETVSGRQMVSAMNSYVRRYASEETLHRGDFSQLQPRSLSICTQATASYFQQALGSMLNLYLMEPKLAPNLLSPAAKTIVQSVGGATKSIVKSRGIDVFEKAIEEQQQRIRIDLAEPKYSKLFTVFSIIDREGNIVVDGKYGLINSEKRREYDIPSLQGRDYVQEISRNRTQKFVCGAPVVGSTSQELMIPIGIPLDENFCLTFGMSVDGLIQTLGTRQSSIGRY
ncbi:MAG: FAD-dependent oxidoreductase [Pseudomonadota bacterium]